MGRRIEVELTSQRDDGSWTWRAAGARQPKGELSGGLLYEGAKVGDVFKVEAEFLLDGIEVTEVFAPKKKKERTDLLEMKSRPLRDDELVTTQRSNRGDRRGGRGRDDRRRRGRDDREDRNNGERQTRRPDTAEQRPKPKRLRPRREHRDALLAEVGDEHRPIVEQVIRDGMPGVRAAIEKQNEEAKAAGKPEIDAAPILAIAERNLSKARLAEWLDRADAALANMAELDLRDLRSVVVAGNDIARDDESRALADQLKAGLDERVEADHQNWLSDLESAITDGRVVRALRLSSRPVKAGAPLPPDLASTLAGQTAEALASDVGQDRWATVLDALAYSPVRGAVTPSGIPSEPGNDLLDAVKRLSDRVPAIAELFGIDPATVSRSARRRRSGRRDGNRSTANRSDRPAEAGSSGSDPTGERSTPTADAPAPSNADAPEPPSGDTDSGDRTGAEQATPPDAPAEQPTNEVAPTDDTTGSDGQEPTNEVAPTDDTTGGDGQEPTGDAPAEQPTNEAAPIDDTTGDDPAEQPAGDGVDDADPIANGAAEGTVQAGTDGDDPEAGADSRPAESVS